VSAERTPLYRFLGPRYWGLWLGMGVLRLLVALPMTLALSCGRAFGWLMYHGLPKRRHIAQRNIELCFPELDEAGRERLLHQNFASMGISLIETGWSWWASDRRVRGMQQIQGLEHLERASAAGKGVILLTAHFTTLELTGRMLCKGRPDVYAMYRRHRNPLFQEVMRRGRERSAPQIAKQDVRSMIRVLRKGKAVWYAPDQHYRGKQSITVNFFGIPAATNTATARMASMTGATVVPFLSKRLPGSGGYLVKLLPPLENFPTDDPVSDTALTNTLIESWIREVPDQYLWAHRRFKPALDSEPDTVYRVNPHKKRKRA